MRRRFSVWLSLALLALAAYAVSPGGPRQWPVYGGDLAGTKYSELDQINRSNVAHKYYCFALPEQ
jgi:glucose dehydrogenase